MVQEKKKKVAGCQHRLKKMLRVIFSKSLPQRDQAFYPLGFPLWWIREHLQKKSGKKEKKTRSKDENYTWFYLHITVH